MNLKIPVSESDYRRIFEAVNERAEQIENPTDELKALFEIRQSLRVNPETNEGYVSIFLNFETVDAGDAKAALREGSADSTRSLEDTYKRELNFLAENITVYKS